MEDFGPEPVCCLPAANAFDLPLPALNDEEGKRVDPGLPPVVDAHVHIFPDGVFQAIWRWFDKYGWPVRYRLPTPDLVAFLLARGVKNVVALSYAHKPGMARALNRFMAEVQKAEPRVHGMGTVFPGEPDQLEILDEAKALGLHGLKLHCHVQAISPDDPKLHDIYSWCERNDLPLVMHAGRAPRSEHYPIDPWKLCAVERVEYVLKDHPKLRLCVPHLGGDEFIPYAELLDRYDHLWLDTTMMCGDYFDLDVPLDRFLEHPGRIMYGTDFPNIPYAWDRELKLFVARKLKEDVLAGLLSGNAAAFFGLRI